VTVPRSRARQRWWISLADLTLLIACFMVPLAQRGAAGGADAASRTISRRINLPLAILFAPGEAMLTRAGRQRLAAVPDAASVRVRVDLSDEATGRFDQWEIAAARSAAIGRALAARGVPAARIELVSPHPHGKGAAAVHIELAR
jgi:hypothetical protein